MSWSRAVRPGTTTIGRAAEEPVNLA